MDTAQFFYRNVIFSKSNNQVYLIDLFNPEEKKTALEGWFGLILILADGQHTIEELVELLSTKYAGAPPPNLRETILSVLERMAESKLVMFTDIKTELPYYLSLPYEQLDVEKAKKLFTEDRANIN